MAPFNYATKVKDPTSSSTAWTTTNPGTFPIQSERIGSLRSDGLRRAVPHGW